MNMNTVNSMEQSVEDTYLKAYRGGFTSTMRWPDLDAFWERLRAQADDQWYVYAVGEAPPQAPASREQLLTFIEEIDALLHREHEEDYCGIVYADNLEQPTYIKIFDPNNLGVTCGFSENPPLPGWILSRIKPVELESALNPPKNRQRWWQQIFS